jgi:hypothetical protein
VRRGVLGRGTRHIKQTSDEMACAEKLIETVLQVAAPPCSGSMARRARSQSGMAGAQRL